MPSYTTTRAVRPLRLIEELQAGLSGLDERHTVAVAPQPDGGAIVYYPDRVDPAAVAAIVDAHDSSVLSATEQTTAADRAALVAFPTRAQVQQALGACDTDLATITGGLTLAKAGPILQRVVENQKALIRALDVLARQAQG